MDILLIATALAVAVLAGPLAVVVIGIHRQERAGLAARPPGWCAAAASKVLALHATQSGRPAPRRGPSTAPPGRDPAPARPPVLASGARP